MPSALYIHFPWCVKKCPYCDFNSHRVPKSEFQKSYLRAILNDLSFENKVRPFDAPFTSVFFGGGTPSLLEAETIDRILRELESRYCLSQDAEVTLEANPGAVERGKFSEYKEAGINRISLGIQSFDNSFLKALGRVHDVNAVYDAIDELGSAGIVNFNFDLMYGLPGQTPDQAMRDLSLALEASPPHLSWYQLTLEEGTVFYRYPPPALPKPVQIASMETSGRALLSEFGLARYEISAYAYSKFKCTHNLNYWSYGDYVGVGPGAHGKRTQAGTIVRTERIKAPGQWIGLSGQSSAVMAKEVSPKDRPFEYFLGALRLVDGFDEQEFFRRTGLSFSRIQATVEEAETDGLLVHAGHTVKPTERGLAILDELLQRFLPE